MLLKRSPMLLLRLLKQFPMRSRQQMNSHLSRHLMIPRSHRQHRSSLKLRPRVLLEQKYRHRKFLRKLLLLR